VAGRGQDQIRDRPAGDGYWMTSWQPSQPSFGSSLPSSQVSCADWTMPSPQRGPSPQVGVHEP